MAEELISEVKDETKVQSIRDVENSRQKRIDKLISNIADAKGSLRRTMQEMSNRKYIYLFNDFGLPQVENTPIFAQIYYNALSNLYGNFIGSGFIQGDKEIKQSSDDIFFKRVKEDAEFKGHLVKGANDYNLGVYFYFIIILKSMIRLNKSWENERFNFTLGCIEKNLSKFDKKCFDNSNEFEEIIYEFRKDLESNPQLASRLVQWASSVNESTNMLDAKAVLSDYDFQSVESTQSTEEYNNEQQDKSESNLESDGEQMEQKVELEQQTTSSTDDQDKNDQEADEGIDAASDNINTTGEGIQNRVNDEIDDLDDKEQIESEYTNTEEGKTGMKHSAFGVQIDYDIPEFIRLNPEYKKLMQAISEDKMIKRKFKDKSMADGEFFKEFKANQESLETGIVRMFTDEDGQPREVWDTISTLTILWLMHQNYGGLTPESTKEDIIERISNEKWLTDLCWRYSFLQNKYLKCIVYKGEKD